MKNKILLLTICFFGSLCAALAQNDTILVDFGNVMSPSPWNNVGNPNTGSVDNLLNSYGAQTGISIAVVDSFNNINLDGTQTPDPSLGIPNTASGDSFFGNVVLFGNQEQPTGAVEFSNLNVEAIYDFTIFCSRIATDNRETQFLIEGATSDVAYLDAASNTDMVANLSSMPTAEGTIKITASPGPNNNNSFSFYYLGAIIMTYPEDTTITAQLEVFHPNGGEFWQVGREVEIKWQNTTQASADLEYSTDNGNSWNLIETVPGIQTTYTWTVADMPSTESLVRVSAGNLSDQSDEVFEISADQATCPIVVIGSSTSAGTGASVPDSSYVNKFRNEIYQNDTRYPIFNLAQGGYTTYHLLPTGTTIPGGININIDTQRNVTAALSYDPAAIIINLPSNDAANNFSVEDQLENFDTMVQAAAAESVLTFVTTTQPRNFTNPNQIDIQEVLRDSILEIYGDYAIDFWNGVADENGFILPELDAGDGIHLNDAGHEILFQRVMAKDLDTLCNNVTVSTGDLFLNEIPMNVYPNPFNEAISIGFNAKSGGTMEVSFYDLQGKNVQTLTRGFAGGAQVVVINPGLNQNDATRIFLMRVRVQDGNQIFHQTFPVLKSR